jgi:hypothetical protein
MRDEQAAGRLTRLEEPPRTRESIPYFDALAIGYPMLASQQRRQGIMPDALSFYAADA